MPEYYTPTIQERFAEIEQKQTHVADVRNQIVAKQKLAYNAIYNASECVGLECADFMSTHRELQDEIADLIADELESVEELEDCKRKLYVALELRKTSRSFGARLVGTAAAAFVTGMLFSLPFLFTQEEVFQNVTKFFGGLLK